MSYSDLLERMMLRDTDAFMEMTDRYGWSLYSAIRQKYPDKADADRIYNDTMQQFYSCLQNPGCDDPMEALLCAFAEYVSGKKGFVSDLLRDDESEAPPVVRVQRLMEPQLAFSEKREIRFKSVLSGALVMLLLAIAAWIIAGFLMEQGMLPYYDLGYSWFCAMADVWLQHLNIL